MSAVQNLLLPFPVPQFLCPLSLFAGNCGYQNSFALSKKIRHGVRREQNFILSLSPILSKCAKMRNYRGTHGECEAKGLTPLTGDKWRENRQFHEREWHDIKNTREWERERVRYGNRFYICCYRAAFHPKVNGLYTREFRSNWRGTHFLGGREECHKFFGSTLSKLIWTKSEAGKSPSRLISM